MESTQARRLAQLLDAHWPTAEALTGTTAAALQAAIWEIVSEPATLAPTAYNLDDDGTGAFWLTGGNGDGVTARQWANDWLRRLDADGSSTANYLALTSPSHLTPTGGAQDQDYLVRVVAVPVPEAILLGLLGLSAAGLGLRRFA
jgi:hypothetical protein